MLKDREKGKTAPAPPKTKNRNFSSYCKIVFFHILIVSKRPKIWKQWQYYIHRYKYR